MMLNAIFTMRGFAEKLGAEPAKLLLEVGPEDVENVQRFFKENHGKPVMLVSAAFTDESDFVREFLDKCCILDSEQSVGVADLYDRFILWMWRSHPERAEFSAKVFGNYLRSLGFSVFRKQSKKYFHGLRLREPGGDAA